MTSRICMLVLASGRDAPRRSLSVLATDSAMLFSATLLASCGQVSGPAASASPPMPSRTQPEPATSPPDGVGGLRLVGASGRTAWQLSASGLSVSRDAGQHWSTVVLPAGVPPWSITTITAAAGRGLWLAVWRRPAIGLYHLDAGSAGWSHGTLVPPLPFSLGFLGGQLPAVSITFAPADVVTVVADWGITSTAHYSTLFISSNDGITFARHPTHIALFVSSDTFLSARQGFIVAGPVNNDLYRTADGGASWTPVTIPGLPSGPAVSYGAVVAAGTRLLLPVIVTGRNGAQAISIYRSTEAGTDFDRPTGPPLDLPASLSAGDVSPAIAGAVIWLPARGRIYQTINAGDTWTTVMTAQSAYPISLISSSQAIATTTDSGCRSFKTGCYNFSYLIGTTDGGRAWRTLGPAAERDPPVRNSQDLWIGVPRDLLITTL